MTGAYPALCECRCGCGSELRRRRRRNRSTNKWEKTPLSIRSDNIGRRVFACAERRYESMGLRGVVGEVRWPSIWYYHDQSGNWETCWTANWYNSHVNWCNRLLLASVFDSLNLYILPISFRLLGVPKGHLYVQMNLTVGFVIWDDASCLVNILPVVFDVESYFLVIRMSRLSKNIRGKWRDNN